MGDISADVTQQALEKFQARIENGCIIVPLDQWKRLVEQVFIGGMNMDVIHLNYKEQQNAERS